MNATEKAHKLREHGYEVEAGTGSDGNVQWCWYDSYGHVVAVASTNAKAISQAYKGLQKLLSFDVVPNRSQAQQAAPVQAEAEESETIEDNPYFENPEMLDDYTGHDYALVQPKFGTNDKVLYYNKVFTVLGAERINGIYAYQLQDTDGEIIGALIAESELESTDSLVSVPDFLAEKNAELEALRQEVAELQKKLDTKSRSLLDKCEENVTLRKFIRDIADSTMPQFITNQAMLFRATVRDAKTFLQSARLPKEAPDVASEVAIESCEVCGGDGWLLEPVEGYKPNRIRCKYCDGTGNHLGIPSAKSRILSDNIS